MTFEVTNMSERRFSGLSKPRQILIRLCQYVNFGSILNVRIADGEIVFVRPPEIVVDVKLDAELAQRPELGLADFVLPAETSRLLAHIDSLAAGQIEKITVHAGIPRRVSLRRSVPLEVII
jgi:hypothetical protein